MFNLICIFLFALLGGSLCILSAGNDAVFISGCISLGIALLWLFISFINILNKNTSIKNEFEKINSELKKISIQEKKYSLLVAEMKVYLGEKYPELEKAIFEGIHTSLKIGEGMTIALANYPEIKSSKTISKLITGIDSMMNDIYQRKLSVEDTCAEVRAYYTDNWFILKPEIPAEIKGVIYSPLPANDAK